jgi:hypothetical protein
MRALASIGTRVAKRFLENMVHLYIVGCAGNITISFTKSLNAVQNATEVHKEEWFQI